MILTILMALLTGAAAPLTSPDAGSAPDGGAPGDGFDVTSFVLSLTPDIQARTVQGEETIALRANAD